MTIEYDRATENPYESPMLADVVDPDVPPNQDPLLPSRRDFVLSIAIVVLMAMCMVAAIDVLPEWVRAGALALALLSLVTAIAVAIGTAQRVRRFKTSPKD